ncbi:MAG: anthranilate synthase component I [Demequinaceae bacterium]|nr:anthranilate synthase component I [Demequinaceae bacterium]
MPDESVSIEWGTTWPTLEGFVALGATHRVVPIVRRLLADGVTPVAVYRALAAERPGTFILESAEPDGARARFSFVGVHSRAEFTATGSDGRWTGDVPVGLHDGPPLEAIREALSEMKSEAIPGLPPLTGGLVGVLGWDIIHEWEPTLPSNAPRELDVPDVHLFFSTDLAAIDHHDGSVWLIANAVNVDAKESGIEASYSDAIARLDAMEADLESAPPTEVSVLRSETPGPKVTNRTPEGEYERVVDVCKEAIRDGEVFQVVPSQRFEVECSASPFDVYRVLRTLNPSPYMYYFQLRDAEGRDYAVVGASPESMVSVQDRRVLTFPIAGSRPRGATPDEDSTLQQELLADPKECAEHIMLVDLARNDLAKVCAPNTVEVIDFMAVNRYSHIMHICSTVIGALEARYEALDAFTATFPAGTLSGAPKPRAIALIDEVELSRRGFYGGAVGYFDFTGNMDTAIAIRTAYIADGTAYVQAGAGIVADSVPIREAKETRDKAAALVRAVSLASRLQAVDPSR